MTEKAIKKGLRVATAIFDYEAAHGDELSFKCDENIQVLGDIEHGWCHGIKFINKQLGAFPDNFVKFAKDVQPKFLYCKTPFTQASGNPNDILKKKDEIFEILGMSQHYQFLEVKLPSSRCGIFPTKCIQFLTKEEADAEMASHQKKSIDENAQAKPKPIPPPRTISLVKKIPVVAAGKNEPKDGTDHPRSSARDVDKKGENTQVKPKPTPPPRTISLVKKTSIVAAEKKEPANKDVTDHPSAKDVDVDKNVYLGVRFAEPPTPPFSLNGPEPRRMPPLEDGPFAQILNRSRDKIRNSSTANNKDVNEMPEINQSLHDNGLDNKPSSMNNGKPEIFQISPQGLPPLRYHYGDNLVNSDTKEGSFREYYEKTYAKRHLGCATSMKMLSSFAKALPMTSFLEWPEDDFDPSGTSDDDDVKHENGKPTEASQENCPAKQDPQETEKKLAGNIVKPSHNTPQIEVPKLPDATNSGPSPPLHEAPKVVGPNVAASTTNNGNADLIVPIIKENNGAASKTMDDPLQEYPGIFKIVNGIRRRFKTHPKLRSLKIAISCDRNEPGIIIRTHASYKLN